MAQISESDIGKRVTIRLHDGDGYRDIVGHLISATTLRNRHGQIVAFDPAEIYIWREINEVPRTATSGAPRSMRIYELEAIAASTWRAQEEVNLNGWILRADIGITKRANSALVLTPEFEAAEQIEQVIDWYLPRNLDPTIILIPELHANLDTQLIARGFDNLIDCNVMVKDYSPAEVGFDYEVQATPSNEWLAAQGDQKIIEILKRTPAIYISIREGERVIAVGRAGLTDEWAVLSRLWVDPDYRGRGFGRRLLQALELEAARSKIALQVTVENKVAVNLYESAGYVTHHIYRIRELRRQINLFQDSCC